MNLKYTFGKSLYFMDLLSLIIKRNKSLRICCIKLVIRPFLSQVK